MKQTRWLILAAFLWFAAGIALLRNGLLTITAVSLDGVPTDLSSYPLIQSLSALVATVDVAALMLVGFAIAFGFAVHRSIRRLEHGPTLILGAAAVALSFGLYAELKGMLAVSFGSACLYVSMLRFKVLSVVRQRWPESE